MCRIYDYEKNAHQVTFLKEITHPESRLKSSELASDKPGHYQAGTSGHGSFVPHSDPKEVTIDQFAHQLAKELDHARTVHAYDKLILIAPPRMEGLLQQHLNKHVKDSIAAVIQKDFHDITEKEILALVQTL